VQAVPLRAGRRRILGYARTGLLPAVATFAYLTYREFGERASAARPAPASPTQDELQSAGCCRLLLLEPMQALALITQAEGQGLLAPVRAGGARRFALALGGAEELVDALLAAPAAATRRRGRRLA